MKKILLASSLFAFVALTSCAQKLDASKVPSKVKSAFSKKFPNVVAEWAKENAKEYEAEFKMNGKSGSANFLTNGSWVETEMEISVTELPVAVSKSIKAKYAEAVIGKVFKIDNSKGETTYEAEYKIGKKKSEVVVKADGTIIK